MSSGTWAIARALGGIGILILGLYEDAARTGHPVPGGR
jgi:hypothetical protein